MPQIPSNGFLPSSRLGVCFKHTKKPRLRTWATSKGANLDRFGENPKAQKKKQNEDRFTKMDGSIPRNSEAIFKVNMQKRFLNKIRGETFFQV